MLEGWGRTVGRHPWRVALTWLVLVVAAFATTLGAVGNQGLFDRLTSGEISAPGQAKEAADLATAAGGEGSEETDTLIVTGTDATDPFVRRNVGEAVRRISETEGVSTVLNPLVVEGGVTNPEVADLVREEPGQRYGFVTVVTYEEDLDEATLQEAKRDVNDQLSYIVSGSGAVDSSRGSVADLVDAIVVQVGDDLKTGEGIALPISFVVMVVVFGGFLAAGLPIAGAIASIAGAFASLLGFSYLLDLDATVVNIVTVLGLGLCIDYGLLVVSRFREELRGLLDGAPVGSMDQGMVVQATGRTLDRAGRTVIFSAITVTIALVGLMFLPITFLRATGAAGMSVVLMALLVATSLIPALCALSARRLLARGTETSPDDGVFSRLAAGVQRAPWLVIAMVVALLVALALPATRLLPTSSGAEMLPVGTPEREHVETLEEDYPQLGAPDVTFVSDAPAEQVRSWARGEARDLPGLSTDPTVTELGEVDGRTVTSVELRTDDDADGPASRALVEELTQRPPPVEGSVGGIASGLADVSAVIAERAPWAVLTVILATFVLLFLMTGSLVVPVKALVMNVVSLGASLGALVWIFQDGNLELLLGFTSTGGVDVTVPMLVIAFGFGLSMDYEVFLLARIVELHEQGLPTDQAVRLGLQRSGRIITSAALLMVIVFSGFVMADVLVIQQTGVALVLTIAIDATLVRMLLVPATMSVLGEANWWAPRRLRRLHERFGISE